MLTETGLLMYCRFHQLPLSDEYGARMSLLVSRYGSVEKGTNSGMLGVML